MSLVGRTSWGLVLDLVLCCLWCSGLCMPVHHDRNRSCANPATSTCRNYWPTRDYKISSFLLWSFAHPPPEDYGKIVLWQLMALPTGAVSKTEIWDAHAKLNLCCSASQTYLQAYDPQSWLTQPLDVRCVVGEDVTFKRTSGKVSLPVLRYVVRQGTEEEKRGGAEERATDLA